MKRILPILLALLIAAGAGWWLWTTSPLYAVQQAAESVKEHDIQKFLQWVDVKSLADNTIEDLLAEPVRNVGGAGLLERILGIAVVSVLKPVAVDSLSKQIVRWVERKPTTTQPPEQRGVIGEFLAAIKPPNLHRVFDDYGFTTNNYKGLGTIDVQGNTSHVGIKFFSPKLLKVIEVQLELDKASGHWEIDRISNLQDIVRMLNGTAGV